MKLFDNTNMRRFFCLSWCFVVFFLFVLFCCEFVLFLFAMVAFWQNARLSQVFQFDSDKFISSGLEK